MLRHALHAKLHHATVTYCDADYVGSITIDRDLLDASGMRANEKVLVADCDSAISALAAVVVPLRATATKICSCRSVRRRVFMADLFAKRSDGYILAIQPV